MSSASRGEGNVLSDERIAEILRLADLLATDAPVADQVLPAADVALALRELVEARKELASLRERQAPVEPEGEKEKK